MLPLRSEIRPYASSWRRWTRHWAPLCAIAVAASLPVALRAAGPLQGPTELLLPSLQAAYRSDTNDVVIEGQEGFGATTVDVQNLADAPNNIALDLAQQTGGDPALLRGEAEPLSLARFDLARETSVHGGYYTGRLSGTEALGAVARTRWASGATVAYEAVPAALDFILPLVARTVYSHTSIINAQHGGTSGDENAISLVVYDREDGGVVASTTCDARAEEGCSWDTAHADWVFGDGLVGTNAPTGGWLGHAWLTTYHPAAVMVYGDEMEAQGSSAYVGRPRSAAATVQSLPLVRSNFLGDSLIAIANADDHPVDISIEYRGASFSPSGAGETFGHGFTIPTRGASFVDLSDRGRGSRPAPSLPRGGAPDSGFVGSALISASGPILAVVQEEQRVDGTVESVSAYNAYGRSDYGTVFSATTVRKALGYQSTTLLAYNPGHERIEVVANLYDSADRHLGEISRLVDSLDVAMIPLADEPQFPPGTGRAILTGTGPFAALVYDERDENGEPLKNETTARLSSIGESPMSGSAKLSEVSGGVRVELELSWTVETLAYYAQIDRGTCDGTRTLAYDIEDPVDRKSTTNLRGARLADLIDKPHCVVISVQGFPGRPPRDVACGVIPPLPGPDAVDTAMSWPVRMEIGQPLPTRTPTPPVASPTPPDARTATPGTGPGDLEHQALLPVAHRNHTRR